MSLKIILTRSLFIFFGFSLTYALLLTIVGKASPDQLLRTIEKDLGIAKPEVIGFLPYWLIDKVDKDYTKYITELTYFGLTVNPDGTILKYTKPGEAEPGWYALTSGKFNPPTHIPTSLLIFNGNQEEIYGLISQPASHAATLVAEIQPLMAQYGFESLNLDIESFIDASHSGQILFTQFVREIKERLGKPITIDASPTDLVKTRLIDLQAVEPYVERVVLMTYDYHYSGSLVTGPVSPAGGAGIESEFDVETGIIKALEILPPEKIILGVPLYGYRWESITTNPRAATLPGSGVVVSNRKAEEFLDQCASCSAQTETLAKEKYLIYPDQETGTYYQLFYPDSDATQAKVLLATYYDIGGMALWALGYEGNTILEPLTNYKSGSK